MTLEQNMPLKFKMKFDGLLPELEIARRREMQLSIWQNGSSCAWRDTNSGELDYDTLKTETDLM